MAYCYLIKSGGTQNSNSAINAVVYGEYPAGNIVTCSSGSTTLSCPDTSGKVIFNIPFPGEWTISQASPAKSVTFYIIEKNEIWNFNFNSTNLLTDTAYTSTFVNATGCAFANNKITSTKNSGTGNYWYFSKKIDASKYTTLTFTINITLDKADGYGDYYGIQVGLLNGTPVAGSIANAKPYLVANAYIQAKGTNQGDLTYNLDLSAITGEYYVGSVGIASYTISQLELF